jgi:hypothetical protein
MYFRNLVKSVALVGSSALVVVGCGGGGSSSTVPVTGYNGIFVDTAVAGISWTCGGVSGVTDITGLFGVCPEDSNVTFSVGNIVLGTIPPTADYIFTPQDVVGVDRNDTTDNAVRDMAALLLSLDADGNATNGIDITPAVITAFNTVTSPSTTIEDLNISSGSLDDLVTAMIAEDDNLTDLDAVTTGEAGTHLDETLADIEDGNITTPDQPDDGSTD